MFRDQMFRGRSGGIGPGLPSEGEGSDPRDELRRRAIAAAMGQAQGPPGLIGNQLGGQSPDQGGVTRNSLVRQRMGQMPQGGSPFMRLLGQGRQGQMDPRQMIQALLMSLQGRGQRHQAV